MGVNTQPPSDRDSEREARTVRTASNLTYIRAQFRIVDLPDPQLPSPSYYDEAKAAYVPHNYEAQETSRTRFLARASAEMDRLGVRYDDEWLADAWISYWNGTYGMCLKDASPENIVRKNRLIDRIKSMLQPLPKDPAGLALLGDTVDELDALERPFCDFDRRFFQRPVSRDTYIDDVRALLRNAL
jgi:Family of unknown function (DUF6058)